MSLYNFFNPEDSHTIANKVLLTIGTVFGWFGTYIHDLNGGVLTDLHSLLGVVLQLTSLFSFFIFLVINWSNFYKKLRALFK